MLKILKIFINNFVSKNNIEIEEQGNPVRYKMFVQFSAPVTLRNVEEAAIVWILQDSKCCHYDRRKMC